MNPNKIFSLQRTFPTLVFGLLGIPGAEFRIIPTYPHDHQTRATRCWRSRRDEEEMMGQSYLTSKPIPIWDGWLAGWLAPLHAISRTIESEEHLIAEEARIGWIDDGVYRLGQQRRITVTPNHFWYNWSLGSFSLIIRSCPVGAAW